MSDGPPSDLAHASSAAPELPEESVDAAGTDVACEESESGELARFDSPRTVGLILLVLAPFLLIPIAHVLSDPESATGFFHYELPYYVANGRAAFERGDGVFYPNPYDPAEDAPVIYAHWLPWIFGALTAKLGFDPGDVVLAFTFFAAIGFAWVTRKLVHLRTESCGQADFAFVLAMTGGGLLACAGLLASFGTESNLADSILNFDPGRGMWFLNWGRNALFPTEAVYHTLVAACWIAEIRHRSRWANVFLLLLITTHPWSGLELLFTINLWRGIEFLRQPTRIRRNQLAVAVVFLTAFLGYYKLWLPTFPSHAQLQSVWELNWSLSWTVAALAYLPVLIPCILQVRRQMRGGSLTGTERFLLCALVVAIGLAFHDRLINPVQPLHFTRGYVWMPLFLIGLPVILETVSSLQRRSVAKAVLAAGMLLFVFDNLTFSIVHLQRQLAKTDGFHLNADERALMSDLDKAAMGTTVLTDSATLNYLLPTYANVRPWLGPHFNTPSFPNRRQTWEQCFSGDTVKLEFVPADVDMVLLRRQRHAEQHNTAAATEDVPSWRPVELRNATWMGLRKTQNSDAGTDRIASAPDDAL